MTRAASHMMENRSYKTWSGRYMMRYRAYMIRDRWYKMSAQVLQALVREVQGAAHVVPDRFRSVHYGV